MANYWEFSQKLNKQNNQKLSKTNQTKTSLLGVSGGGGLLRKPTVCFFLLVLFLASLEFGKQPRQTTNDASSSLSAGVILLADAAIAEGNNINGATSASSSNSARQEQLLDGGSPRSGGTGQWPFGYASGPNSKRARKMSAFMPMRGRRSQLMGTSPDSLAEAWVDREPVDGDGLAALAGRMTSAAPASHLIVVPPMMIPNRFLMQHIQHRQRPAMPVVPSLSGNGDGGEQQLMEAKPRRAFHPMRGKKSWPPASDLQLGLDQLVELATAGSNAGDSGDSGIGTEWTGDEALLVQN